MKTEITYITSNALSLHWNEPSTTLIDSVGKASGAIFKAASPVNAYCSTKYKKRIN